MRDGEIVGDERPVSDATSRRRRAPPRRCRARSGSRRARLPPRELLGVALQGLRTRKLRAALSALGIAIGIGAMVAVVGVSASSQANLLAEIDALGTNLLTVTPGTTFLGNQRGAAGHLGADDRPHAATSTATRAVYQVCERDRAPHAVRARRADRRDRRRRRRRQSAAGASATTLASGPFPRRRQRPLPRGRARARRRPATLQITHVGGHLMVYLGNTWFTVVGILKPVDARLDARLDRVHLAAGRRAAVPGAAEPVRDLRARERQRRRPGLEPAARRPPTRRTPSGVSVTRPSDALEARAAAKGQFTTLLLGLGAVALLVGAIGIANIMVISVLERRGEIGLRRALGATRRHISAPVPRPSRRCSRRSAASPGCCSARARPRSTR